MRVAEGVTVEHLLIAVGVAYGLRYEYEFGKASGVKGIFCLIIDLHPLVIDMKKHQNNQHY